MCTAVVVHITSAVITARVPSTAIAVRVTSGVITPRVLCTAVAVHLTSATTVARVPPPSVHPPFYSPLVVLYLQIH